MLVTWNTTPLAVFCKSKNRQLQHVIRLNAWVLSELLEQGVGSSRPDGWRALGRPAAATGGGCTGSDARRRHAASN
jgi:hypothetical protein